jgi:hypothetical protein
LRPLLLGVAALFTGLFANVAGRVMVVGAGVVLVFFGVSVLGRTVSLPLSRAVGAANSAIDRGFHGDIVIDSGGACRAA